MTLLEINLTDVLSETDPDDRVVVWAPAFREGPDGQLVGPRQKAIPLADGVGSDEVVPGPLMVQVRCKAMSDTLPREVVVPEEGPVTLTGLFDSAGAFTYAPPVVSQVTLAARRAEDAAVRAEGVADAFGSLEGVVDQVQAAEAAASSAEADRLVVEQAATSASWSGDRLTVLGATSPPLTGEPGPAGAAPYVGANGNWWVGDTDTGVRAQGEKGESGDGAGDVLWSDLNPILDGKAAVSHDHTIGQVTGLQSALDGKSDKSDVTVGMVAGKIVQREPDSSNIRVSEAPQQPYHAAARSYVDTEVGKKADASRVTALEGSQPIIVSSLPSSPLPGRIYLVTG